MSISVYRIREFPIEDNSYTVGRQETWQAFLDRKFDSTTESRDYIKEMTRVHVPYFTELTLGQSFEDKERFAEEFCFTNDLYLKYRRFFIGPPPWKKLGTSLNGDGVRVTGQ